MTTLIDVSDAVVGALLILFGGKVEARALIRGGGWLDTKEDFTAWGELLI